MEERLGEETVSKGGVGRGRERGVQRRKRRKKDTHKEESRSKEGERGEKTRGVRKCEDME